MKKVYKWSGTGLFLGAEIIVIADNKDVAENLIKEELTNIGLSDSWNENPIISEEMKVRGNFVVHSYDGDY